jgi:hypothetical protein
METSIFAFATDLRDEGIATVLDNVQGRAGLGGVTIAAAYHDGRDVFPHNPVRKVRFLEEGAIFFRPDEARWRDVRLRPPVSEAAGAFAETVAAAAARDLAVNAWTVFLHNGALAQAAPDCAPENAFGDRYVTELCPASPDVRRFAETLAADVAAQGVATIVAESLHHHPLDHGVAHERYFAPLGERARFLLGLCFCRHCLDAAERRGTDGEAVRRAARGELERVFAGGKEEPLEPLGRGVEEYVRARAETVTTLAASVAEKAHGGGARLEFIDLSGAVKGYATGRPEGEPAAAIAWRNGADLPALAEACDGLEAIGYAADPGRLRLDLEAYRAVVDELSVVLRPMPPDCDSASNLREKVALARELGLRRVDFYHYGLMRLDALDLIREALPRP